MQRTNALFERNKLPPGDVKRAGVMGWPVKHSLSPRLQGYWLKQYGIKGSYEALAVRPENLEEALRDLPFKDFRGVNLTVPHKEAAIKIVDRLDPLAERIGAVNTVVVLNDGKLEGQNTDVFGFKQNLLSAHISGMGKIATVLGAGGATRAVIAGLQDLDVVEIRLANRTKSKAEQLAKEFGGNINVFAWDDRHKALAHAELLVNATVLGMIGQPPLDIELDHLPVNAAVTDLVYAPLMTDLLKRAQGRGNKTADGLGMLLHQARPAFHAFFGKDPDVTPELRAYVLEAK